MDAHTEDDEAMRVEIHWHPSGGVRARVTVRRS